MKESSTLPPPLSIHSLKALSVLGRGAKGVVFLAQHQQQHHRQPEQEQQVALKVISKLSIEKKKKKSKPEEEEEEANGNGDDDLYKRIWFERDVLKLFDHPLLPKLKGIIVTDEIVAFAIDYCSGGDLNTLRKKQTEKMFSDEIIRFYAAELVLALEYLHNLGIIYRDLKPENIMIQENGHLMLIDFDLSTKLTSKSEENTTKFQSPSPKKISISTDSTTKTMNPKKKKKNLRSLKSLFCNSGIAPVRSSMSCSSSSSTSSSTVHSSSTEKTNSFVGTEEYVAPEIITGNGHDFSVDWWGLGVVLYEMLYGRTPFKGINRKETFYRILSKSPELVGEPTPLRDLIGKLLEKDPMKRITVEGIKGHEFFVGLDWDSVTKISRPPYIPSRGGGGELVLPVPPLVVEEENKEELDGIKGIDVEKFVNKIFNGDDAVANKENHQIKNHEEENKNVDGDHQNDEGLLISKPRSHNNTNTNDFLIF